MPSTGKKRKSPDNTNEDLPSEVDKVEDAEESDIEDVDSLPPNLREFVSVNLPNANSKDIAEDIAKLEAKHLEEMAYDSEDSEHERELNTIGNVPIEWYDDYDHIGYDLEGKKILRSKREDEIDKLLAREQLPWSVYNEKTGKRETLTNTDMEYIKRLQQGLESERYSPAKWFIELNEATDKIHAAHQIPRKKSSFLPSKWEAKRVRRLVHAIRKGWIKLETAERKEPEVFLMWDDTIEQRKKGSQYGRHIPAPKPKLPGHIESYNPPEEYLLDDEEKQAWKMLDKADRPYNFLPTKNSSLRVTPGYNNFQEERFERCLDLYLATRVRKKKNYIDPESLTPQLPKPSELKPYPTQTSVIYTGHDDKVRTIDTDPTGQWIVSGSDDKTVRIWEVSTGRQFVKYSLPSAALNVVWNPNPDLCMIAVATEDAIMMYLPSKIATVPQKTNTEQFFEKDPPNTHKIKDIINWSKPTDEEWKNDLRLKIEIKIKMSFKYVTWHHKGDYFSTVCPNGNRNAVLIHQLSKQQSQNPFTKSKGIVECVKFHPTKPYFFVATQKHIRIYNLAQQKLQKKLLGGSNWVSSIDIHPGGDNLILGGYDRRVCWYDLDMGSQPYKILRYHSLAVRATRYHRKYPLFASSSDDGCIHIFHGMVYNDLLQNAFIVPLKILHGHKIVDELGILDIVFHPTQPWIFSAGSDGTIVLHI